MYSNVLTQVNPYNIRVTLAMEKKDPRTINKGSHVLFISKSNVAHNNK